MLLPGHLLVNSGKEACGMRTAWFVQTSGSILEAEDSYRLSPAIKLNNFGYSRSIFTDLLSESQCNVSRA